MQNQVPMRFILRHSLTAMMTHDCGAVNVVAYGKSIGRRFAGHLHQTTE